MLDRDFSPVVLIMLIYMYMNQTLRVQWCQTLTSSFQVCNDVNKLRFVSYVIVGQVYVLLSMFVNNLHLTMTKLSMVPKVKYCFFKGRFSNVSACCFHVNGQYVEISKCAMNLIPYPQVTEQKL